MPLLKRKTVHYHPLPSLSSILQPLQPSQPTLLTPDIPGSSPTPKTVSSSTNTSKTKVHPPPIPTETDSSNPNPNPLHPPPDSTDDDTQLDRLLALFKDDLGVVRKDAKGRVREHVRVVKGERLYEALGEVPVIGNEGKKGKKGDEVPEQGEGVRGEGEEWRVWDRECFYVKETGEIFTDYESYCNRLQFLSMPLYQCEVSGKSALSFHNALASEQREARLLHTRFPAQLKRPVLSAVQFQIEGKLDNLADKIFERFINRFFDDEKIFLDVDGDKYLARIIRTFPPKSSSTPKPKSKPSLLTAVNGTSAPHALASDLNVLNEDVIKGDDPMGYFYNVRLIEEGVEEGFGKENGNGATGEGGEDDVKWEGSVMEVKADKISRDRLNFSRAILKRFIRDCIHRDAAVYSPWLVKKTIANHFSLPTEMPEDVRKGIAEYKEKQMDKRKREREERLGIIAPSVEEDSVGGPGKKRKVGNGNGKISKEDAKEEEERRVEEAKKRRPFKVPTEDLLVEYSAERDAPAGRIGMRPAPSKSLPFGDQFEQFLMTWSFLNVMGTPLNLSPFTLDDFESSLYHTDPSTPAPLLTEIHACLLNTLIADLSAGHEPVRPLKYTGKTNGLTEEGDNETDYWEGKKGATTETLQPIAAPLASTWKVRELSSRDGRRGWQESLVGCLWDRATLDTLPTYLDNILHLLFEDKPPPTRPTWSTGPPANSAGPAGLILSRPEKRYPTLHFTHKLDIIGFLVELVGQTAVVRDYLEESIQRLTEIRKEQVDVKREWKRIQAEKGVIEPKEKPEVDDGPINGETAPSIKGEPSSRSPSIISRPNGIPKSASNNAQDDGEDEDELDETPPPGDDDLAFSDSVPSSPISDIDAPETSGAARRKAMAAAAASRSALESEKKEAILKQRAEEKEKKAGSRQIAAEKKRLSDEEESAEKRLRELEYEFRSVIYTLRARPMGYDRYGNKIWWMDGLGSAAPLITESGKISWGTGRIYIQGPESVEVEMLRLAAGGAMMVHWYGEQGRQREVEEEAEVKMEVIEERRIREEGEGKLNAGEWGVYDTPEQLSHFISYLNPRGIRELSLLKTLRQWLPEIEGGMRRRRIMTGLEEAGPEEEGRRVRMTRKAAGEEEGWMNWKNKRAV